MTKTTIILCVISLVIVVVVCAYLLIDNINQKKAIYQCEERYMYIVDKAIEELGITTGNFKLVAVQDDLYILIVKNVGVYLVGVDGDKVDVESKLI